MFSCEFGEISKNNFFHRTPPVAASDSTVDKDVQCFLCLVVSTKETNSSFFRKNKNRSSRPEVFCKKSVLRNFAKLTGKHLCQNLFLSKITGLIRKETLTQVFSCEFFEISKNTTISYGGCFCKNYTQLTTKLIAIT